MPDAGIHPKGSPVLWRSVTGGGMHECVGGERTVAQGSIPVQGVVARQLGLLFSLFTDP